MSEIILNPSENSDNKCLSGEGQMVGGVGRLCTASPTRVCRSTAVLGCGSVSQGQVPCISQGSSAWPCISHTPPPGCPLNAHLPKNRLLFYLSALLMLTGLTTLQVFLAFYWKIWCNNLHSQLGKLRHGEMNKVMKGQKHRNSPWWSPIHCQCLETVPLRVFWRIEVQWT